MLDEFRSTYITWDKATSRIYSPVTANASDENGRKLNIQVVNSGQVENLTGATLHLYWETKDKSQHGLDPFDASDISKGEFEIFYTTGMLSNVGELNATLVLVDATGKVVSDWFKITVTRGINESAIESENSFSSLTQALIDISDLEQNYAPRLNNLTAQLQQTASNFKLDKDNESAPLGDELSRSEGWQLGTNWSGDFNTGFTHSHGAAGELVFNLNAVAGSIYFVKLTVTDTDTMNSGFKFHVIIGDSHESEMYRGVGSVITYTKAIKAENNGEFKVLADSDFTGTVTDISIKEVVGTIQPTLSIKDENGDSVFEVRPSLTNLLNLITGRNAGRKNISGYENTVYGDESFTENVSGFWNTVSGKEALAKGVSASRNNAYGYKALAELIDGTRNQAYGTFALTRLKYGSHNVAMGADTLWKLIEGDYNIAFGTTSLDYLEKGLANIGIGYKTLSGLIEGSYNVAIGHLTARNTKVNNQTAVGAFALSANINGNGLSAFGYGALRNALGNFNSAFGDSSLLALVTGTYNDAFGRTALASLVNGIGNKVFGGQGLRNLIEGSYNIGFGFNVGQTLENGSNNILIGNGVDVPDENTSNHMNIGKLIFGDLANNRVGIGIPAPLAKLHIGAGTASVAPIRINAGALLSTPQQHVMEYDGAFMYITSSSGIRRKFVTEPA